ncbi:hypothetical protein ACTWPB_20020 [Nocardia sp. IBHARD005]|uniref:hypothetical protein n=1 Tax=Nocardia sp. IBHARD005 TaxID=3457765 RepID=UPI004059550B
MAEPVIVVMGVSGQLDTLEPLRSDEVGVTLNASQPPSALVAEAVDAWIADHR